MRKTPRRKILAKTPYLYLVPELRYPCHCCRRPCRCPPPRHHPSHLRHHHHHLGSWGNTRERSSRKPQVSIKSQTGVMAIFVKCANSLRRRRRRRRRRTKRISIISDNKKIDQFALIEMNQVYFLKLQPVNHLFIFFNAVNQIFKLVVRQHILYFIIKEQECLLLRVLKRHISNLLWVIHT